jgi:hypothetical protein
MDNKVKEYTDILIKVLEEHAVYMNSNNSTDYELITDEKHGHYSLIYTGWRKDIFDFTILFHFQIKPTGKVWLLVNNTDILITDELVERGIPKSDIVIGFIPESLRQYSGFAVA